MSIDAYSYLTAAAGLLILVYCVALIRVRPQVGLALIALVALFESVFGLLPSVTVAGIRFYGSDGAYLAVLGAAAVPRVRLANIPTPVFVLGIAAIFALMRGVTLHGPNAAGNEARGVVGFVCVLVFVGRYAQHFDPLSILKLVRFVISALLLTCGARWATTGIGSGGAALLDSPFEETRALPSSAALLIAASALALLYPAVRLRVRWAGSWLCVLVVTTVLLQHRSVWIAFGCAATVAFLTSEDVRAFFGRSFRHLPLLVGPLVIALALGLGSSAILRLQASTQEVGNTRGSTLGWREESNAALLSADRTAAETVVGKPFGSGYERRISTAVVTVSPHNAYLEYFLRTGLVGLVALLAVLLRPVVQRGRTLARQGPPVVLLLLLSVYGLAYGFHPAHAAIVAGCVAALEDPRREVRWSRYHASLRS